MSPTELMNVLNQFSNTGGAQIKYYIVQSLYPDAPDCEKEKISGIYTSSYRKVKSIVEEKNLPLLKFDNLSNLTSEAQDNAAEIEQLQKRIAELREQKQEVWESLQKQVDRKDVLEKENAALMQQLDQLQSNLEAAADQIENLTKGNRGFSQEEMDARFSQMMQTESELRNQVAQLTRERDDWKANAQAYKGAAEKYKKEQEGAARPKNPLLYGFD